jgi:chitinase
VTLDAYGAERGQACLLTAAWPTFPFFQVCVDLGQVIPLLDFINVMTYDMEDTGTYIKDEIQSAREAYESGQSSPIGVQRKPIIASHHSKLYPGPGEAGERHMCVDKSIKAYLKAGIPPEKLVVGAAFYSKQFQDVPDGGAYGLGQITTNRSAYGPDYTEIAGRLEADPAFTKHWDDGAKACWLYDGSTFITYEDPRAIGEKCAYVKKQGLRGVMYWVHGADKTGALFEALREGIMKA